MDTHTPIVSFVPTLETESHIFYRNPLNTGHLDNKDTISCLHSVHINCMGSNILHKNKILEMMMCVLVLPDENL